MKNTLATLEHAQINLKQTAPYHSDLVTDSVGRASPMRFTHACGARPLEGYTIKRGIGIGGFGEVYFALSDAGKEVALKRIQRNMDIELRGVGHCLNLKHVNLISLWDIRRDPQGYAWVVMEYVPGESLRDAIERADGGMSLEECRRWFEGMAAGVKYLHGRGVVHRDLKPGNIFQDDDDDQVVKIGDYGLSKLMSCGQKSGQTETVGTFHYMAPEIGRGVYGKEIDLYALGVILYEMLTGDVPFNGESSQEIIMKHLTADPDLERLRPGLRKVVGKALRKDPDFRYRSIDEMLVDFRKACESPDEPLLASEASLASPALEPPRVSGVDSSVMYISDDGVETGSGVMYFGDVREVETVEAELIEAELISDATVLSDEPVARSLQASWQRAVAWWNHGNVSTPVKVAILVVVAVVLLANAGWIVPVVVLLGMAYGFYLLLRTLGGFWRGSADAAARRKRDEQLVAANYRATVLQRSRRELLAESMSAFSFSGAIVATLSLFTLAVSASLASWSSNQWAFFAWMVTMGVVSTWTLLGFSKTWEGKVGDAIRRRFGLLISGIVLGVVSFVSAQFLMVDMTTVSPVEHEFLTGIPEALQGSHGSPSLAAHLVFFGGLMFVLRWWLQTDPVRKTRLSYWRLGWTLLAAAVVNEVAGLPFPWAIVLGGIVSVGVQIASTWVNREERQQLLAGPVAKATGGSVAS